MYGEGDTCDVEHHDVRCEGEMGGAHSKVRWEGTH